MYRSAMVSSKSLAPVAFLLVSPLPSSSTHVDLSSSSSPVAAAAAAAAATLDDEKPIISDDCIEIVNHFIDSMTSDKPVKSVVVRSRGRWLLLSRVGGLF